MQHLNNLIESKHEDMKRKLFDLVDGIHREEQIELESDLSRVKKDMREWQKKCEEPVNYEVFVASKLQIMDQKLKRQEQFEEQLKMCDTYSITKKRLAELADLCKQFGMRDFVKDKITLNDRQMLDQFVYGIPNAFQSYKQTSNINRTFLACNFKEKEKSKTQVRIENIIR